VSSGYLDTRGKLELVEITDLEASGFRFLSSNVFSTGTVNKILSSNFNKNELILCCQNGLYFAQVTKKWPKKSKKEEQLAHKKDLELSSIFYLKGKRVA
jgi:hypothetical protein